LIFEDIQIQLLLRKTNNNTPHFKQETYMQKLSLIIILLLVPFTACSSENVTQSSENTETIARKKIFEHIQGESESEFFQKYKKTGEVPPQSPLLQELTKDLHTTTPTLKELRKLTESKFSHNNGSFNIFVHNITSNPDTRYYVDIASLQAAYPNAVFQTASRPNGLEGLQMPVHHENFDPSKNGIESILGKWSVQGEEAQLSCAAKGIVEIYYTKEDINFFDQLNIKISPTGNLTHLDPSTLRDKSIEDLSRIIRVAHWQNVPVTSGYANVLFQSQAIKEKKTFDATVREKNSQDENVFVKQPHYITQVNVTALDVNPSRSTAQLFNKQFQQDGPFYRELVAQAALRAAYEGTIRCAVAEGKKEIFLTLVGGGSFQNKLEWITESLEAISKDNLLRKSGCKINLICLSIDGHLEKDPAWDNLQNIALRNNGRILDITHSTTPVKEIFLHKL